MKLYYDKRLSDPTYYVQQGFRNGKKTTTRNVKTLGKHSELLKITDNPLAYCQDQIQKLNEEYRAGKKESVTITMDFNERVDRTGLRISPYYGENIGYFFLQHVMKDLKLKDFFRVVTENSRTTVDCYTVIRFLTYARILDPGSKRSTWDKLDTYYERPKFGCQHILRSMDVLAEHSDEYLSWLFKNSNNVVKRDTSVLYYDCSNFCFECEQTDHYADPNTGELLPGLRQYGTSKENRPNPIVEMGLFMDRSGIPITMCLHPGNTSEGQTVIPLEEELLKVLPNSNFIYCADASLGSYHIRFFHSMGGRAFIVTQSLKKLSDALKTEVFRDHGYRLLSSNKSMQLEKMKTFKLEVGPDPEEENSEEDPEKARQKEKAREEKQKKILDLYNDRVYKVIYAPHAVDLGICEEKVLKNGKTKILQVKGDLEQRLIVTFSRKLMEYQRHVRDRQVARARALLKSSDPENIKKGPNDVKRFLKRIVTAKSGDPAAVSYALDQDKIEEEEKYDGFYCVATNLSGPAKDILAVSEQRHKIENCFRIMKTNLEGRPVYHHLENRIKAHFLICYTALLVQRLLEVQLDQQGTHVTTKELIDTMKNLSVLNQGDVEYAAEYGGSETLDALTQLTQLPLDRKHYRPKDLNRMIKNFLK